MRKHAALAAALLLSACGAYPDSPVQLPPGAGVGRYSPTANAISGAAEAFGNPAALAGRPAEAAVAVERLEWLAEAVPRNLEFTNYSPLTAPALQAARAEVRAALGIAPDAPPSLVIGALDQASSALARGDAASADASLAPPAFAPGMVARLSRLPFLPQASFATSRARRDLEFGRDEYEMGFLMRR
ncbi:hypothetical protein [Muricoccus radiodurans]|uniref:hypothetical protein n=1 Tax=Muricoccus radiodurans TaxID=2231721 RepID=UPI003CF2B2F0